MAKITSRPTGDQLYVELLRDALVEHSMGAISTSGGVAQPAETLETVIPQAVAVLSALHQTIEQISFDLATYRVQIAANEVHINQLESTLEALAGDVDYDEALDHATMDLMQAFESSGAAEVNADGELAFDDRVVLNKEDLKPILREAIIRWIEQRIMQ